MKIAILGYSNSGKSTLAERLGGAYEVPVIFLDKVQFLPGWQERNREEARALVAHFMEQDGWVIDGNYSGFLQEERLQQADRIILLCFNRFTCLYRAVKRYFQCRNTTRASMAEGCPEKLDWEFCRWILYEGRTKKKRLQYRQIAERYRDKTVLLGNQRALDSFLGRL